MTTVSKVEAVNMVVRELFVTLCRAQLCLLLLYSYFVLGRGGGQGGGYSGGGYGGARFIIMSRFDHHYFAYILLFHCQ